LSAFISFPESWNWRTKSASPAVRPAIRAAEDQGDFSVFHALHDVLQKPYEYQANKDDYMQPPQPHEEVRQTFCGT